MFCGGGGRPHPCPGTAPVAGDHVLVLLTGLVGSRRLADPWLVAGIPLLMGNTRGRAGQSQLVPRMGYGTYAITAPKVKTV